MDFFSISCYSYYKGSKKISLEIEDKLINNTIFVKRRYEDEETSSLWPGVY